MPPPPPVARSIYVGPDRSQGQAGGAKMRGGMQILLKDMQGRQLTLDVEPTDTTESIRQKYKARTGELIDRSRIIFRGQQLFDHHTLAEHGVGNGDTLHIVLFTRQ